MLSFKEMQEVKRAVDIEHGLLQLDETQQDIRKLSKAEHHELEKPFIEKFNKFYGMNKKFIVKVDGTDYLMDWSDHAKAQFVERIGLLRASELYPWFEKIIRPLIGERCAEYLVYSKSKKLGAVVDNFTTDQKRVRLITVLPYGKYQPKNGDGLLIAENVSLICIEID